MCKAYEMDDEVERLEKKELNKFSPIITCFEIRFKKYFIIHD